jgi:hypothetical protein
MKIPTYRKGNNSHLIPEWFTEEVNDMMLTAELRPFEFHIFCRTHDGNTFVNSQHAMSNWVSKHATLLGDPPVKFTLNPVFIFRATDNTSYAGGEYFVVYNKELFYIFKSRGVFPSALNRWYSIPRETILPFTKAPLF